MWESNAQMNGNVSMTLTMFKYLLEMVSSRESNVDFSTWSSSSTSLALM